MIKVAMKGTRLQREYDKFVEDVNGNTAIRALLSGVDIQIGAVEIKDGESDTRAKVKNDDTDNALVVTQNSVPTTTVTAEDLDIRDLSQAQDNVRIYGYDYAFNYYIPKVDSSGKQYINTLDTISNALPTGSNTIGAVTQAGDWDINKVGSVVDSGNSTTATLAGGATFTGTGVDLLGYSTVCITLHADVDSATDGMKFEFSSDNSNWDDSYPFTMDVSDSNTRRFQYPVTARYFRIRYINGAGAQSTFRVQTILHTANQLTSIHRIKDTLFDDNSAQLMLSVLSGKKPDNNYINFQATAAGNFMVSIEEFENAVSVNSNTQLRTTRFDSSGNEAPSMDANTRAGFMKIADSSNLDAFGRLRVSNPENLFDSKQIFDNQPLFWDESLESGADITSAHSVDTASTVITSTDSTAGKFTRQTFMRFNYQPGKSQLISMTGILDRSGGGTGVQRRIGMFDDDNGIFFEDDEGTIKLVRRTKVTGSVVDNKVSQTNWNIDKMDGTGVSGITVDWTKLQIFSLDFEWLGVGRVRMGLFIDGVLFYVHEFLNANLLDKVYMSTPNLPLRYQMITTGSSPVSTMECNCSTVMSEGGTNDLGVLRYKSTAGAHIDAATENTIYAIVGIRLKSTHFGATVKIINMSLAEHQGSKFYEWMLILNPTITGTFTYGNEANSAIQTALGDPGVGATTVTNGTIITGGFASSAQKGGAEVIQDIENAIRLGADISGTVDTIVLCVRPVGGATNLDIEGSITWRELS